MKILPLLAFLYMPYYQINTNYKQMKLFFHIKDSDPFVNAVYVKYGWAITVHKAIGSNYNEVIIKGHTRENDGITNDSYFR